MADLASQTLTERVRDTFHKIFEERDFSTSSDYWSDESVDYFLAPGETVRGERALTEWFRSLFAAIPDWRLEIESVVDDGDRQAVVQWRAAGTFNGGPFFGLEPTGTSVEIRGVDVIRFDADGKVESNTVYYDGAEFARQVGMLPRRGSALDRLMLAAFNARTRLKRRLSR